MVGAGGWRGGGAGTGEHSPRHQNERLAGLTQGGADDVSHYEIGPVCTPTWTGMYTCQENKHTKKKKKRCKQEELR